jgi:hypothetical protein
MPRNAELSPNTFLVSPTDCSACVSGCTPGAEWFAFFSFMFEGGGAAIFELRVHVQLGVRRVLRRGPAMVVRQDNIVELLEWRKKRLALDGVKFLQVTPIVAKQMVDTAIESCGQTLLDQQPWGKSWHALNQCIFTLQFRHDDYADDICNLDLRLGTSSADCVLREASLTQSMNPALRTTTQNGKKSYDALGLGVVPLVGGAGGHARARLRGTFVSFRNYNYRDATNIASPELSSTSLGRPGTVAGEGHADVPQGQVKRAMAKANQVCSYSTTCPITEYSSSGMCVLHYAPCCAMAAVVCATYLYIHTYIYVLYIYTHMYCIYACDIYYQYSKRVLLCGNKL